MPGPTPSSTAARTSSPRLSSRGAASRRSPATPAEHVVVFFACAKAGAILHPISWRLAPAEIAFQLDDAEPAVLLVEDELRPLADAALELAHVASSLRACRGRGAPRGRRRRTTRFSSSTRAARPASRRARCSTHANCFWTNLSFDLATGLGRDDVVLQVLPQFHVGGWNVQSLLAWWKGARVVLERGFDAARALELIERERVTTMMGVPANYLFMAEEPRFADADLSSLRLRGRRRRADAGAAARRLGRARRRDRPGLRPDRGGAERALPAVRGCAPQGRARRAGRTLRRLPALGGGRAARPRAQRLPRLLAQPRRDRRGVPRRLAPDRRRRRVRRGGRLLDPRAPQGTGCLRR